MKIIQHSFTVLIICLLVSLAGCSSNKGKIEGTKWTSQAGNMNGQAIPAGFIKLEFGEDGTLVFGNVLEESKGTYSLGLGEFVTLTFDGESHMETIKVEGNTLEMFDSDGQSLKFTKVE